MATIKAATVHELEPDSAKRIRHDRRRIALVRRGDDYFAIDDTCPHEGASLSQGRVLGGEIVCPLHAARFLIHSGEVTGGPARKNLSTYPVRIEGEEI